jgi:peptidoglycan/LPS O-acetylase OafA/YrhL
LKNFYKQLEGLRALAVLSVMISHWVFIDFVKKLSLGFWGVNLFFVLSGFLISENLLKQIGKKKPGEQILKQFYLKRILRIFPAYYFVMIIAFIINLDNARQLALYNFTYTLNFYNAFSGDIGHALSHIWSLCVEEQFYLIWPLLLLIIRPKHHQVLIVSTIMGAIFFRLLLYSFNVPNYNIQNYRMMPGCMDALGLGALLAYLKLNHIVFLRKGLKLFIVPLLSFLGFLFIEFGGKHLVVSEIFERFFVSVCSFFLIGIAVFNFNNWFGKFLEYKFIQYLGKISYGLYLYHLIISSILESNFKYFWENIRRSLPAVLGYNSYIVSAPFYFLITVLVASLSYFMIEKPFLVLKSKLEIKWSQMAYGIKR